MSKSCSNLTLEIWIDIAEHLQLQELIMLKIAMSHSHLAKHLQNSARRLNLLLDFTLPIANRYNPMPRIWQHSQGTTSLKMILRGASPRLPNSLPQYIQRNWTSRLTRLYMECSLAYLPFLKTIHIGYAQDFRRYLTDVFDQLINLPLDSPNPWLDIGDVMPNLEHLYLNDPIQISTAFSARHLHFVEKFLTNLASLPLRYLATNLVSPLWHGMINSLPSTLEVWILLNAPNVSPIVNEYETTSTLDNSMACKLPKSLRYLDIGNNSVANQVYFENLTSCKCSSLGMDLNAPLMERLTITKLTRLDNLVMPSTLTWLDASESAIHVDILSRLSKTMILLHCSELLIGPYKPTTIPLNQQVRRVGGLTCKISFLSIQNIIDAFRQLPPKITSLSIKKINWKSLSANSVTIDDLFLPSIRSSLMNLKLGIPLYLDCHALIHSMPQIETIDVQEFGMIAESATAMLPARILSIKCQSVVSDGFYASQQTSPDVSNTIRLFDMANLALWANNWSKNCPSNILGRIIVGQQKSSTGNVVISNIVKHLPRWCLILEKRMNILCIEPKKLPRLLTSIPGSYACEYCQLVDMPPYLTNIEKTLSINLTGVELTSILAKFDGIYNEMEQVYIHPETISLLLQQKNVVATTIDATCKTFTFPLDKHVLTHFPSTITHLVFTVDTWFNSETFDYFPNVAHLTIKANGQENLLTLCYQNLNKLKRLTQLSIYPVFTLQNFGFDLIPPSVMHLVIEHDTRREDYLSPTLLSFVSKSLDYLIIRHPCLLHDNDLALLPIDGTLKHIDVWFAKNITVGCLGFLPKSVTQVHFESALVTKALNKLLSERS